LIADLSWDGTILDISETGGPETCVVEAIPVIGDIFRRNESNNCMYAMYATKKTGPKWLVAGENASIRKH
jgi:hypothetical protein